jgi:hypothetical protein
VETRSSDGEFNRDRNRSPSEAEETHPFSAAAASARGAAELGDDDCCCGGGGDCPRASVRDADEMNLLGRLARHRASAASKRPLRQRGSGPSDWVRGRRMGGEAWLASMIPIPESDQDLLYLGLRGPFSPCLPRVFSIFCSLIVYGYPNAACGDYLFLAICNSYNDLVRFNIPS